MEIVFNEKTIKEMKKPNCLLYRCFKDYKTYILLVLVWKLTIDFYKSNYYQKIFKENVSLSKIKSSESKY